MSRSTSWRPCTDYPNCYDWAVPEVIAKAGIEALDGYIPCECEMRQAALLLCRQDIADSTIAVKLRINVRTLRRWLPVTV